MGAAGPRWAVVDELVHELGSLRAVVQEVEAEPDLVEHDVALELRTSLARAADTIHLVIGGDEGLVSQARRCIAEAQEVGRRARLVQGGNTVVVIEHNLDVIKTADHVIDMGPDGGDAGGRIVATGTPEEVVGTPASYTGRFLADLLPKANGRRRAVAGQFKG